MLSFHTFLSTEAQNALLRGRWHFPFGEKSIRLVAFFCTEFIPVQPVPVWGFSMLLAEPHHPSLALQRQQTPVPHKAALPPSRTQQLSMTSIPQSIPQLLASRKTPLVASLNKAEAKGAGCGQTAAGWEAECRRSTLSCRPPKQKSGPHFPTPNYFQKSHCASSF